MQKIIAESTINAPIEVVWDILENFDNYHTWNDFCPKAETTKVIGDPFVMTVYMKPDQKPIIQKETFSDYEPLKRVGWSLDWGFWLKTHRIQDLKKLDDTKTHYYTEDKFWGLLTPLVMALYRKDVQRGFDFVAKALKDKAEKTFENKLS
ncbi:MAG: SRPBCC domain-containing protein [Bacteroidota bacterium]